MQLPCLTTLLVGTHLLQNMVICGIVLGSGRCSCVRHRSEAAAQQYIRPHRHMLPNPVLSYRLAVLDKSPTLPQLRSRIYNRMENRRILI
jgi:hypothetical protein